MTAIDALSRCETPRDCECSNVDMEESLKCDPCKKCLKRARDMGLIVEQNSWQQMSAHDSESAGLERGKEPLRAVTDGEQIPGTSTQQQDIDSSERQSRVRVSQRDKAQVLKRAQ